MNLNLGGFYMKYMVIIGVSFGIGYVVVLVFVFCGKNLVFVV